MKEIANYKVYVLEERKARASTLIGKSELIIISEKQFCSNQLDDANNHFTRVGEHYKDKKYTIELHEMHDGCYYKLIKSVVI